MLRPSALARELHIECRKLLEFWHCPFQWHARALVHRCGSGLGHWMDVSFWPLLVARSMALSLTKSCSALHLLIGASLRFKYYAGCEDLLLTCPYERHAQTSGHCMGTSYWVLYNACKEALSSVKACLRHQASHGSVSLTPGRCKTYGLILNEGILWPCLSNERFV